MAKPEKAKIYYFYVLNIKLRKKTSSKEATVDQYADLFKKLHRKKIHKESSPGKHIIIRFLFEGEKKDGKALFYSGSFAQFTFIQNERWFNLSSLDIDEEFKLPDGLFPDAVIVDYIFVPSAHRFAFRTQTNLRVSPYPVKKYLESALNEICSPNEFVQVDVETDRAALDKILNAKEVRYLDIDINYSNTDNGSDIKKLIEEDMKESNSQRLKIEAFPKPDTSLDIDSSDLLKGAMEIANSNGEVVARIKDENDRVQTIRTSQYPRKEYVFGTLTRFNDLVYTKLMQLFRPNARN